MIELVCDRDHMDKSGAVPEPESKVPERERSIKCVNVFKTRDEDMMQAFTKAWIELMNQTEQRKAQITNTR